MSGSVQGKRLESRDEYIEVLSAYKKDLSLLKNIKDIKSTGSFVSNKHKHSFGDIDIVLELDCTKDDFIHYLTKHKEICKPFPSNGKLYSAYGTNVTICYEYNDNLYQIDNILTFTKDDFDFKYNFFNLPAEKQGLYIGLVKVFVQEHKTSKENYKEFEFNLSYKALEYRNVKYNKDFKLIQNKILTTSLEWGRVIDIVSNFVNPYDTFEEQVQNLKNLNLSDSSKNRIKGLFKSLVTIKKGELNTKKAKRKEYCINLIEGL